MQVIGFRATCRSTLHLSQPVSKPSAQPVLKRAIGHELGQSISNWPAGLETCVQADLEMG